MNILPSDSRLRTLFAVSRTSDSINLMKREQSKRRVDLARALPKEALHAACFLKVGLGLAYPTTRKCYWLLFSFGRS